MGRRSRVVVEVDEDKGERGWGEAASEHLEYGRESLRELTELLPFPSRDLESVFDQEEKSIVSRRTRKEEEVGERWNELCRLYAWIPRRLLEHAIQIGVGTSFTEVRERAKRCSQPTEKREGKQSSSRLPLLDFLQVSCSFSLQPEPSSATRDSRKRNSPGRIIAAYASSPSSSTVVLQSGEKIRGELNKGGKVERRTNASSWRMRAAKVSPLSISA